MQQISHSTSRFPVLFLLAFACTLAFGTVSSRSAEPSNNASGGETLSEEAPILELRWARNKRYFNINMDIVERVQANRVWYAPWVARWKTQEDIKREYAEIRKAGMPVTVGPGGADGKALLKKHPDWGSMVWRYLMTKPKKANASEIDIRLSEGYGYDKEKDRPKRYRANFEMNPNKRWRVFDVTNGNLIPSKQWSVNRDGLDGVVNVEGVEKGHDYSVLFLGGPVDSEPSIDRTLPDVYKSDEYWASRIDTGGGVARGADFVRSTGIVFGGWVVGSNTGKLLDWYSYGRTITPRTVKQFEKQTGHHVNPMWWIDEGKMRAVDDPPSQGLLRWMTFIQKQVKPFAKAYTDWTHEHGCKAVMFWGDSHIGMEPYLGMVGEAGYDEITMPSNNALDSRRVTDFHDPEVDRCIRIWTRGNPPGASLLGRWRSILRGALYHMPEGVSIGGSNANVLDDRPAYGDALRKVYREYDRVYRAAEGTEAYNHDLNLYIVNAWGHIRSWPRSPWAANPSQQVLLALTDLPIRVHFISLRKIANEGVPKNADVLLNAGEPGSAWSGDHYWDNAASANVRQFVKKGGGLIGIGAPALNDDKFMLPDVFGLSYEGRVSEAAHAQHYRNTSAAFHEFKAPPKTSLTLTDEAPAVFDGLKKLGDVPTNTAMKPDADTVQTIGRSVGDQSNQALVTINRFGKGRAAYATGHARTPPAEEFLQRLIYHMAGKRTVLPELHSPTPGGHVYYYPEADKLFVYNRAGESDQIRVRAGVLGEAYGTKVRMRTIYAGRGKFAGITPDVKTFKIGDLRHSIKLNVPSGDVKIYRLARGNTEEEKRQPGAPITFRDGADNVLFNKYAGTEDTLIVADDQADENVAGTKFLVVGNKHGTNQRALMRFDLTVLQGLVKEVEKAELVLKTRWAKRNPIVHVYPVTKEDGDWQEQQVTWLEKKPGVPWAGGAGGGAPGEGTYASSPFGTLKNDDGKPKVDIPAAMVKAWISGENRGLLLRTKGDARTSVCASEAHGSNKPMLKVYCTLTK